jgi:hypothetical protein
MNNIDQIIDNILELEEQETPDWQEIKKISDKAIDDIQLGIINEDFPHKLYQFLDDYDIREKSQAYASSQRGDVREILSTRQPKTQKPS